MPIHVSSSLQQTGGNCAHSPDCSIVASAAGSRLSVYDATSLAALHVFPCVDKIDRIEISPDSCYVLCALLARGIVQVFSVADPAWRCRINESVAGITSARWCPDSRHILVESDFGIQIAVWSLVESTSAIISSPKAGVSPAFSECGRFLAVAHRLDCKDYIGVYSTVGTWTEVAKFKTRTSDLASITWSNSGAHIIVADSNLCYKLIVYSASGDLVCEYEAYENALGIRCLAMHRSPIVMQEDASSAPIPHPLFAIGSYDNVVRELSTRSWAVAFELPLSHPSEMLESTGGGVVPTVEVGSNDGVEEDAHAMIGKASFSLSRKFNGEDKYGSAYASKSLKILPKPIVDARAKGGPVTGVSWVGYSGDGRMLAARSEAIPRCLWIWDGINGHLAALLVQISAVTCARWRPFQTGRPHLKPLLAFCTGVPRVYFWSPDGASWIDMPVQAVVEGEDANNETALGGASGTGGDGRLLVQSLKWSPDGRRLLCLGKASFCSVDVDEST